MRCYRYYSRSVITERKVFRYCLVFFPLCCAPPPPFIFKPHEFTAVFRSAGRGSVRNNAPHHGKRHNLHQDFCRRASLSHQRRFTSEIFRDFRGYRRGGGDYGQTDGKIQRIRLCDHGGQGGSRASVQRCKPHHRRQEGQREPGVPGSKTSQLTVKSFCWSSASPSYVGSEAVWARSAVRLPTDIPPAQPAAPFSPQPHGSIAHLPLPGLQLRLHPLCLHRTGAVPLHPITVTLRWLPQLQLLPQHASTRYNSIANPSVCHPSSSSCTHCCVCRTTGLPPLSSAPAGSHAVSG